MLALATVTGMRAHNAGSAGKGGPVSGPPGGPARTPAGVAGGVHVSTSEYRPGAIPENPNRPSSPHAAVATSRSGPLGSAPSAMGVTRRTVSPPTGPVAP